MLRSKGNLSTDERKIVTDINNKMAEDRIQKTGEYTGKEASVITAKPTTWEDANMFMQYAAQTILQEKR